MVLVDRAVWIEIGVEDFAIVEGEVCLIDEQILQFIVIQAQRTAVEPYEERGLGTNEAYARNVLLEILLCKEDVLFNVLQHLLAPLLTMLEGGNGGDRGKDMGLVQFVGTHPAVESLAKLVVGHDGIRTDYARHVEGLGGVPGR